MTTFQAGTTYYTRSLCDHNCIISLTVASRTAKTITTAEGKRLGIKVYNDVEYVKPDGSYSMAPSVRADGTKKLLPDWENAAPRSPSLEPGMLASPEAAPEYQPGESRLPPTVHAKFFGNAADVWTDAKARLAEDYREHFLCYFLDVRHRLIECWTCAIGSMTGVEVHPREVFRKAIAIGAASVIFVHNHPSNDPTPSRMDIELTTRLRQVGELCGIAALDHVIVSTEGFVSLASRGWC